MIDQETLGASIAYTKAHGGGGGGGDVTGVKGDAESTYRKGNVNITPANIGLGNVDNTSDLNKPVSTAQQTALDGKVDKVAGKGLSENDYTDADKAIVGGVTSALAGKADASSVPTKTSDLTNDSGFITNLVNNLLNYYLKSETYSKAEVDTIVSAITTLDIQAVSQLPTTNISTTTIYLVPKQDAQVPDIKDEYINLDGTTSGWELIGNTQIDLSNYVTTSDLTTALQSYATKAYVDGLTFVGTQAQWNALTTEQKKAYKFADITDDYDDNPVGNLNALTTTDKSSAVAAINEVNGKLTVQTSSVSDLVLAKFNGVVFVNGTANLPCTIPEGFRPQYLTKVPCVVAGVGEDVVSILPTGVLEYGALGTQTGTVIFQAVYI